jgi:hypothetical protein
MNKKPTKKFLRWFFHESNLIEGIDDLDADKSGIEAWNLIKDKGALTELDLLAAHRLVTAGQMHQGSAGTWRTMMLRVGWVPCPAPSTVREVLDAVIGLYGGKVSTSEEALSNHVIFERVHPCDDGNGRLGRLLLLWQEHVSGLPLTMFEDRTKGSDYYPLLNDRMPERARKWLVAHGIPVTTQEEAILMHFTGKYS